MLKRLVAIVLCTQMLTACDIELPPLPEIEIPEFLKDIDIRVGLSGDVKSAVVLSNNLWHQEEWIGIGVASFLPGNSLVGNLDTVTAIEIGTPGNFKPLARVVCDFDNQLGFPCPSTIECKDDGATILCETPDSFTVVMPGGTDVSEMGANLIFRVIVCNTNLGKTDPIQNSPLRCNLDQCYKRWSSAVDNIRQEERSHLL